MTKRRGKIAQLPFEIRTELNGKIRDGVTYAECIAWLEERKQGGISESNLSNWVQGDGDGSSGYQDWLRERARLEDMAAKREFALEIVRQNEGSKIHEASLQLAASQLYDVITDFDIQGIKELLAEKPENYTHLVNSLAKLSKGALEFEKFKDNVRQRKEAIERELGKIKSKGGLTPETIQTIERELNLL